MLLYCNATTVLATHSDHQNVKPESYGEEVDVISVPDNFSLERIGSAPDDGEADVRPFARPVLSGEDLAEAIRIECRRRIYSAADAETQANMTAAMAAGVMSTSDASAFANALGWIAQMRSTKDALIASDDNTFTSDAHWPEIPSDAAALADQY